MLLRILVIVLHNALLVLGIRLARVIPPPVGNNAMMMRHNAYIDFKVRQYPPNMLNHQNWHGRHIVLSTSLAPNLTSSPVSMTTLEPTSVCGGPPISTRSSEAAISYTSSASSLRSLAVYKPPVPTLVRTIELKASQNWDEATDESCTSRLASLAGVASNPSGQAICYNVQSIDNRTGTFSADLRLYRIAPATGEWSQAQSVGMTIGLSYSAASVQLRGIHRQKRDSVSYPLLTDVAHVLANRVAGPLRSRSNDVHLLQTLDFAGQIAPASIVDLQNRSRSLELLSPKINLASKNAAGTQITTQLALSDASFVNGPFADLAPYQNSRANGSKSNDTSNLLSPFEANTFAHFPLALILVSAWSIMILMSTGWEMMGSIKVRNEDRRRMRANVKEGWDMAERKG